MELDTLKTQVKTLLDLAKIPTEEKTALSSKVDSSTQTQLEQLKDNLLRQITADAYFGFLDELETEDKLLSEEDLPEIERRLEAKLMEVKNDLFTETEIAKIKENLSSLQDQTENGSTGSSQ